MRATRGASGAVVMILLAAFAWADEAADTVKQADETLKLAAHALDKQDFDRAIGLLDRTLKLNPKSAVAHVLRGLAHSRKGERDTALADYERALKLDTKSVLAYASRGSLYRETGDFDKALADFDKAVELDGKNKHRLHQSRQRLSRQTRL